MRRAVVLSAIAIVAGCGETVPEYTERTRVDELLTRRQVTTFLRIVESLPESDDAVAAMTHVFAPLPNWDRTRTLPVSELLRLERASLESRWDVEWLVRRSKPSRRLSRALAREHVTYEQFIATALAIGAALRRSTVRPEQDLPAIVEKGRERWAELETDTRPFASLPPERQYRTLQQAAWLVRAHRADKLDLVPAENVERVVEYVDRLRPHYPPTFLENPFDGIVDALEEYGIPFRETAERDDDRLEWSRLDAIVGRDQPDPEFLEDPEVRTELESIRHRESPGGPILVDPEKE